MKKMLYLILILFLLLSFGSCCRKVTGPKTLPKPHFSPSEGSYYTGQSVTITCSEAGADIRYTMNGSDPTNYSTLYDSPIPLTHSMSIKAKAYKDGWQSSSIASAYYTVLPIPTVSTPLISPTSGTYYEPQTIHITCSTSDATIRFTMDGTEPTATSPVYGEPFYISTNAIVKAKAMKTGYYDSAVASAQYYFTIAPPAQFVYVQSGTFNNGTSNMTVSSFFMDKYEVTQSEYQNIMGINPSSGYGLGIDSPVYYVSWFNAIEYCNRRSLNDGLLPCYSYSSYGTNVDSWPAGWNTIGANHVNINCNWAANGYRLPTEMEWMYAARGGLSTHNYTYSGSSNIDVVAWYSINSGSTVHTVGTKTANELGIYDMSGNVWEFVWDIYNSYPYGNQTDYHGPSSGSYRCLRGGGWNVTNIQCGVSYREMFEPQANHYSTGFRVVRKAE